MGVDMCSFQCGMRNDPNMIPSRRPRHVLRSGEVDYAEFAEQWALDRENAGDAIYDTGAEIVEA